MLSVVCRSFMPASQPRGAGQPAHGGQAVRYTAFFSPCCRCGVSGFHAARAVLPSAGDAPSGARAVRRLHLSLPVTPSRRWPSLRWLILSASRSSSIRCCSAGSAYLHGAVRDAVCFVSIAQWVTSPSFLAADQFARSGRGDNAVCDRQTGFLLSAGQYIVTEGGVFAVFTDQADDPSGSINIPILRVRPPCVVRMCFPTHHNTLLPSRGQ
ncbi:hypothetical protein DJICPGNB_18020 [Escherichia coli]|nr:hypothetical protein DJICPGNB_18020 [Escherichia coli]